MGVVKSKYPIVYRSALSILLADDIDILPNEAEHLKGIVDYMARRYDIRYRAYNCLDYAKDISKQRYDIGVRLHKEYSPRDLIILYNHSVAGDILKLIWRGPFVVNRFSGDIGKLYLLR